MFTRGVVMLKCMRRYLMHAIVQKWVLGGLQEVYRTALHSSRDKKQVRINVRNTYIYIYIYLILK